MISPEGKPKTTWRGIDGKVDDPTALISGFMPVLVPRTDLDQMQRLTPLNLVASWYWVEGGQTPRPVRLVDLKAALLSGDDGYNSEILGAFDANQDGALSPSERVLDSQAKVDAVRTRLEAVGVVKPHIAATVQPYGLHHGVGPGSWATRDCATCHQKSSRLGQPFLVASYAPGGVVPKMVAGTNVNLSGELTVAADGRVVFEPNTQQSGIYVLGYDNWEWVDRLGAVLFVLILLGVAGHGLLRIRAGTRHRSASF